MKTSPRILILSSGHPARNPRAAKEAETLGNAGFEVTLLTPKTPSRIAALDTSNAVTTCYRHQQAGVGFPLLDRLLRGAARRAVRLGLQTSWALGSVGPLRRAATQHTADLVIVHNEAPHWIGTRLQRAGRRIAADIEDWHSEDLLPEHRLSRPLRLLRQTESALLHTALFTTTTSHALAAALHARYGGKRPEVISNSFPLQPIPTRATKSETAPAFFWFSQTLGRGRGLEAFVSAWTRMRLPSRLVLLGEPYDSFDKILLKQLPPEFRSRVSFRSLVAPEELPAVIAEHDIGLALEQRSILSRDLTITNKILQYFNAGLAVVATDTAGQREALAHEPDAGVILDFENPEAAAQRLDELIASPERLRERQQAARRLAETRYCWEREAPRLIELVERALASS